MNKLIILTEESIKSLIKEIFRELRAEEKKQEKTKLFSINQARKILGRSNKTVSNLVKAGVIEATVDNRISEEALDRYLKSRE